ncbi:unnamed protein product [Psylliodes chrysocephalus]|uniref:SCP domain-containing protein n=1 Tax=Psylliodes chrysocephalus TaxID=3402493 RepID=A0A9P0GH82_9CUCU|nr:unnamed protein product [Psylliodes chrysocephala]
MYQLYLLWLFFLKFLDAQTDEYCVLLSCGDTPNTVCARALWNCGPDVAKCGADVKDLKFTPVQREFYVAVHNKLRAKVANGEETRGDGSGQPSASNMNALTFDEDLEHVAQCWTNNCEFNHDKCRKTTKYSYVGQNLAAFSTTAPFRSINITARVERMITSWYNEVGRYKTQKTFQSS